MTETTGKKRKHGEFFFFFFGGGGGYTYEIVCVKLTFSLKINYCKMQCKYLGLHLSDWNRCDS